MPASSPKKTEVVSGTIRLPPILMVLPAPQLGIAMDTPASWAFCLRNRLPS
ncbi:hypothetical protein FHR32_004081 [Streptosporangium album]|uniref:Uncharacterized protein n=1 Tax=Streptosporangium album TaxID=47479 RepID=A0A7W7RYQ5_9ACTN|nr:hypothetical protein [Streptosporangium album]MBB4939776.1 hypothetical protein [Streptosporangium album]